MERARGDHSRPSGMCDAHQGGRDVGGRGLVDVTTTRLSRNRRRRKCALVATLVLVVCGAVVGGAVAASPAGAAVTNEDYGYLNQIGGPGAEPGQFGGGSSPGPYGVAVDSSGNVFVVDPNSSGDQVSKFAPDGGFLCGFGSYGSTTGMLWGPYGIAIAPDGTVFVIDTWRPNSARIQYFTTSDGGGSYQSAGEIAVGSGHGKSFQIAADGVGNVYISDTGPPARVLKYRVSDGVQVATIGATGAGAAILDFVKGVAVSADGLDLYAADSSAVKRYQSSDGGLTYAYVGSFASDRSGSFGSPWGLALDASGHVFVADSATDRISKHSPSGECITEWGGTGSDDHTFRSLRAVAVSASGCVYAVDPGWSPTLEHPEYGAENHRVMRYARDLTPPVSTVAGLPAGWSRAAAVTLTFSGDDPAVADAFTSGYELTQVFEGGSWVDLSGPRVVTAQGTTTVRYRAVDAHGNAEADRSLTVRIDRTRPVPRPVADVSVQRGKKAKLRYRVTDAWSPQAKVKIVIRRRGAAVKRLTLGLRSCGVLATHAWRCTLAKGSYTWTVTATDLAGNAQARTYVKKLVVR
ncbi:MAG TPA: hypothetical protein PLJ89_05335 [Thermoleophilia bacterium]|nr:hypothetical protein [Thermoleophilia bacterium]